MFDRQSLIEDRFSYHQPDEGMIKDIQIIRDLCKNLAVNILRINMDERCRQEAMTKLEEISMWANKGIVFRAPR